MIIDVHAHALSDKFLADMQRTTIAGITSESDGKGGYSIKRPGEQAHSLDPNLHNLERRLESLRRRRVELQLFGPSPGFISWQSGAADIELARAINAQAKEIESQSEGLMEAMAVPTLGEPTMAVTELERAMDDYGFRSVILPTSAGGRPLDDEIFEALFAFIEKRGLLVFIHPTSAFPTERFGINGMNVLLGWPFETTLAITRLIFAGTFERHAGLNLILAHSGGTLIFLRGRLDAAYAAEGWEGHPYYKNNITKPPTYFLDRLHYDTCSLSADSLHFAVATMGVDRLLFGSDYPFDVGDPEGRVAMPALERLEAPCRSKILRENALGILPPA